MNPLGTVPIFVSLTDGDSQKEINKTAMLTSINVFVILVISFFLGKYVLAFFGISLSALKIAGGLVIASSGFALLKGEFSKNRGMKKRHKEAAHERERISLTPLAIPMMAGPGSISLLIGLNEEFNSTYQISITLLAVIIVCLICYFMMRGSQHIIKVLGPNGINSISRIIGFIVIALGVEYLWSGIYSLIKTVS
jgi:multiple antibiotic resistance protein|tara:strand:+ start:221 stop:805 length:585 start_codon:yes stop_codon:yes gene_type:complete